ncbi:DUF5809 family protein [Natranaeroarchaeum aerophilus]|uniref:DUF5809 family protein n=1 Tax=Natranaeroarchaeum aerophilus TaxID=2917711 RepID=A0AAE3K4R7_9EURY|nr:DUF5809 family protein [Natranaeroarchaeum aerophilus]MCL9812830.1 DUF5809 family protein [Natranaeroarchaeum aerophilus]
MHTTGLFSPDDEAEAVETYDSLGPAAQTVVKETAKAMAFDADEYDERVTGDVIETARDALFASLLSVQVGTVEEFEAWCEDFDGDVEVRGSEHVDNVVWHVAPGERAVAATFQSEERAAVGTLRRQAFGTIYRELVG